MNKNLRWRVITILVVVALGVWAFYPPGEKINLGLDLKGGVHLVLRVQTDDALKLETETTVERLRDTLTRGSVAFAKLEQADSTSFVVEGIQDDQAFRQTAVEPDAVFNRASGAGRYTYTMKPNIAVMYTSHVLFDRLNTPIQQNSRIAGYSIRYGTVSSLIHMPISGRFRIISMALPIHIDAIRPQNNCGLLVITCGPGWML